MNNRRTARTGQELCGFKEGDVVLIFDNSGHFDTFAITNVQDWLGHLQHRRRPDRITASTQARRFWTPRATTYYSGATKRQKLMRCDGGTNRQQPVMITSWPWQLNYFRRSRPPQPKPALGNSNCLYDAAGNHVSGMTTLTTGGGSLAPLPISMFTDGPWCGGGSNLFDADLYRVRKVKITVRVQTPNATFRGQDTALFQNPGTAKSGQKFIPDLVTTIEVSPRNLNLSR